MNVEIPCTAMEVSEASGASMEVEPSVEVEESVEAEASVEAEMSVEPDASAELEASMEAEASVGGVGDDAVNECCEQMVMAFHNIAHALAGMQGSMQDMRSTLAKTDIVVRSVKNSLKTQGVTVLKLKRRLIGLERRDSEMRRSSSLLKASREAAAAEAAAGAAAGTGAAAENGEGEQPVDPGLRLPASASASTSQSASGSKAGSLKGSSVVCFPRKNRPSLLLRATSRSGAPRTLTLCRTGSRPRLPCTLEVTTPPPVGASCDERLGALGVNLLRAAQAGRLPCVRGLVDAGADPNFAFGCKWTPLHRAAAKAHAGIVSELLDRGSDVHATTVYGLSPLHVAAYHDFSGKCVQLLMDAKANPVRRDFRGRTPLHYAAENGNLVAVRALRAAGASQNAKDNRGRAPFDLTKTFWIRRLIRSCSRGEWSRSYVCRLKKAERQGKIVTKVTKVTNVSKVAKKKREGRETCTSFFQMVSESKV